MAKRPARAPRTQPTTRIEQGEAHRFRLRYTKLGRVAFLGHLDLVRHLPRIFRRAGVELNYSVGFHPKPELSFGPALGLGIPSLGELLDVKLGEPMAAADLVRRLQRVTLDGVDWLGGVALGHNDRALGRVIARGEFWARLPLGVAANPGVTLWREGTPLAVKRRGEGSGVGRMIDVRRAVLELDQPISTAPETVDIARRLQWDGDPERDQDGVVGGAMPQNLVRFHLIVSAEGSAKPTEVIEGLWGAEIAARTEIARVALWGVEGNSLIDPLDAETLRCSVALATPSHALLGDAAGSGPGPASPPSSAPILAL